MKRQQFSGRIETWNKRFSQSKPQGLVPTPSISFAAGAAKPGTALDLACGTGRHAIFLAERGWRVIAVDGSRVGINLMLAEAEARHCRNRIEHYVKDLEAQPAEFVIEPDGYDLIADCFFLHRPLFSAIRFGVRPGGLFVGALHVSAPGLNDRHRFVLKQGQLVGMVRDWGWKILYESKDLDTIRAVEGQSTEALVAQRPA